MFTISVKKPVKKWEIMLWFRLLFPFYLVGGVTLFSRKHQHHMKFELLVMSCTFLLPTYLIQM